MSYIFDQSWRDEKARLDNLSTMYDPGTAAVCDRLEVAPGWRCLDIGAGTGTVVRMLTERVGPQGEVLAVDADTRFLEPLVGGPVSVVRSDVTVEPLPTGFDFVHARLLLEHLPSPEKVLLSMTEAARPGGWVVVEDLDWSTALAMDPPSEVHERVVRACESLFTATSYDPYLGRRLPRAFRQAGLVDIGVRTTSIVLDADPERGQPAWEQVVEQCAPALLERSLVTRQDLDDFHRLWHDGDSLCFGPLMVSTWGRRPLSSDNS